VAIPCLGESEAEVISIPPQYQNLDNYYVVGGTNGQCYIITGPTAGPQTVTWNGLVYGQNGDCSLCPPAPTPIPCLTTHPYLSSYLSFSTNQYGNFSNNYSLACSSLLCLSDGTCNTNGAINPMHIDTPQIQVGTVFYSGPTTCNYYGMTGFYIAQNGANYVLISISNGIVTQVLNNCS
jgi:hypothetical protein